MGGSSIFVHLSLVVMTLIVLNLRGRVTGQAVRLNMDLTSKPFNNPSLSCSLDHNGVISMETIDSLNIYGPRPFSTKQDLETLATVSRFNPRPQLVNGLTVADAGLTGFFGSADNTSELVLSWKKPFQTPSPLSHFRCSVLGTNRYGQAVSISDSVQVGTHAKDTCPASEKMDLLLQKFDLVLSANASSDAAESRNDFEESVTRLGQENALRIDALELAVRESTANMSELLARLQGSVATIQKTLSDQSARKKLLHTLKNFHVSEEFRDKRYLVSKTSAVFNLRADQAVCVAHGGYLLEVDDEEEYQFARKFTLTYAAADGVDHFMTSGNDLNEENQFVYDHSKQPVPANLWADGEPNDYYGKEDCVQLADRLNDVPCDVEARYVCEVQ